MAQDATLRVILLTNVCCQPNVLQIRSYVSHVGARVPRLELQVSRRAHAEAPRRLLDQLARFRSSASIPGSAATGGGYREVRSRRNPRAPAASRERS